MMSLLVRMILSSYFTISLITQIVFAQNAPEKLRQRKLQTNLILILADDLGYGDLGWGPFTSREMQSIETPELQKMAKRGITLTNFHTAAPVCSPSRASIMVGLFPWRLGVDFIYAGDLKKDGSEEMDHEQLPLIPNLANSLKDAGEGMDEKMVRHLQRWY